jgi:threonine/homoserine/homoserine lactone efflux protein
MTAAKAFVLALPLPSVNPKHLVMVVAGATVIADATARVHEQVIALVVFVVVASLGVAAPAVVGRVLGDRSAPVLAPASRYGRVAEPVRISWLVPGRRSVGNSAGPGFVARSSRAVR